MGRLRGQLHALVLFTFVADGAIAAAGDDDGFKSLFDGKTLEGWKAADMSYWSVEDGAITGKITKEHPLNRNLYLVWQGGELADFELKMMYRMSGSPGINGGFQFRSRLLPNNDIAGYQMDNNLNTDWLCRLYEEHGRDTLAMRGQKAVISPDGRISRSRIPGAEGPAKFKLEEWHEYHLICQGSHLTLKVNGELVAEALDDDAKRQAFSGILGLQLHSGPPTTVQFKDIRLKVLKPAATRSAAAAKPAFPVLVDKTLVAWVSPANLSQRGGSVLTLDDQQSHFDGIVFGELAPARWMAGSDFFRRTQRTQENYPAETAGPRTLVQMAIVYKGNQITVYRDGKEYARHEISQPQTFDTDSAVVMGLRHIEASDRACFAGTIDDVRIYNFALSAEQIAALQPNRTSDPRPLAWWSFEDGTAKDLMGTFPEGKFIGSARIVDGKLILDGKGSYLITPPTAAVPQDQLQASMATPTYHFTSPTGLNCMPFDPNGAIFWKGQYHLGYIYQDQGKHFWGHASSADLLNWKRHPPMLSPNPGDPDQGIFSGNAFVDKKGRVVIHYHGVGAGNCIAVNADDELNVFKKLAANPVMKDPGSDPHGWLEGDTYYSISGGNSPSLYKSLDEDQIKWKLLGKLMSKDLPDVGKDEDTSCPDLFKLGDKHILLCISHKRGARYYIGRFENDQFHPEQHFRMNWPGGVCFAPETLLDARGRRIMWAWAIGDPSSMTLPRVLSLGKDGVLQIEPAPELDALRRNPKQVRNPGVAPDSELVVGNITGDTMELRVKIDPKQAAQCGVKVRRSPDGQEETAIVYDARKKVVRIELARSSLNKGVIYKTFVMTGVANPDVTAQEAPFELRPGETLDLRIYLDKTMLEVFANGRQCLTQRIYPMRQDSLGVCLFCTGGEARFNSVDAWEMAPTGFER